MIHTVSDSLLWGDIWSVRDAAEEVDAILNVGWPFKDHDLPGIEYKLKYFDDVDPFPIEDIWECVLWIDGRIEAGKKVYVHCYEGNSRSVSTIVAYLHYRGMAFEQACERILSIKPRLTISGEYTDEPLFIRDWFRRDWLGFAEGKNWNGA